MSNVLCSKGKVTQRTNTYNKVQHLYSHQLNIIINVKGGVVHLKPHGNRGHRNTTFQCSGECFSKVTIGQQSYSGHLKYVYKLVEYHERQPPAKYFWHM